MSCDPVKNPCPVSCRKVKEQLRLAIKELPNVTDGIFPRKENDVEPRLPSDVIPRDIQEPKRVIEAAYIHKIPVNDVRPEVLKDIETKPTVSQEFPIIQEPTVISTEKIADDIEEKIDLIGKEKLIQEPIIIPKETVTPTEKIIDHDEEKIDFIEEKEEFIQEPAILKETVTPTEKIADDIEEKIDFVEEEEFIQEPAIIPKEIITPTEKIVDEKKINFVEEKEFVQEPIIVQEEAVTPTAKVDRDEEKIDLITEEKLDQEPVIIEKETVTERIADRDDEKIDFIEEKDSVAAEPVQKVPIAIEEPEIIEDEIEQAPTKIELEPSQELEEHFEPEERMEYGEEEESITDYEKFIDEELQESLPAVIAREIPEEPKAVRREISRNAATLYERIDRERPVRPPREREAVTAMPEERPAEEEVSARRALENSTITEQIVSRKPAEDICEETCPLVKEQKERIMRKLKVRQRVVDHYYLTKGFSYFEDVCTCSLACMVYTLSRDPFVKSIFASLALFAVGLKLCSELDAWEMPSRVS